VIACFFGYFAISGHVATIVFEQRRMLNSEWHTVICLLEAFREIRKENKRRCIILNHESSSSHTSALTKGYF
jgi:hypothetical protein